MTPKQFTIEQAIAVQQRQLNEWQKVLKPEIFRELKRIIDEKTEREKHDYKFGYEVMRGTDIDAAIWNWFILNNTYNQ
jgi:hypothetical protein